MKSYSPEEQGPAVLYLHEVMKTGNGLPVLQHESSKLGRRKHGETGEGLGTGTRKIAGSFQNQCGCI